MSANGIAESKILNSVIYKAETRHMIHIKKINKHVFINEGIQNISFKEVKNNNIYERVLMKVRYKYKTIHQENKVVYFNMKHTIKNTIIKREYLYLLNNINYNL